MGLNAFVQTGAFLTGFHDSSPELCFGWQMIWKGGERVAMFRMRFRAISVGKLGTVYIGGSGRLFVWFNEK